MRFFILVAIIATCSFVSAANVTQLAPEFVVNLDLAPEHRWDNVAQVYQSQASAITEYFEAQIKELPVDLLLLIEKIVGNLDGLFGEKGQEMRGLARALNVDLGIVVILNFGYELRKIGGPNPNVTAPYEPKACTSIVAEDPNAMIYHARNMDWNMPNNLRNLTFTGNFQRGGKTIFKGACFCGFVGILTGTAWNAKGAAAGSIDERADGGSPIADALEGLLEGAYSPTHLLRDTLDAAGSTDANVPFQYVLNNLSTQKTTAPVYYIISGDQHGDGAVITRDRNDVADLWQLWKPNRADPNIPHWYVLETNYDNWVSVPATDNRRGYGINYMNKLGQNNVNLKTMFDTISKWPLTNDHTSYTAIMCPATHYMSTYIRFQ